MMLVTWRRQSDPSLLDRLDPAYWHPGYDRVLAESALPLAPLGEFVTHITYGAIVTGEEKMGTGTGFAYGAKPECQSPFSQQNPPPCEEGVTIIHQGQVAETGVDPRGAVLVVRDSPWDIRRARLQREDIVLPRSGQASVAKNRVSIFLGDYPAVVGSFVDLVRVSGLDPFFALICLKTELVWSQIHRIINGVGTPNISFDEIRSLRVPVLEMDGVPSQLAFRQAYLTQVHPLHLRWLAGDEAAGEQGRRELRALVERLNQIVHDSIR
jgi:hypothetical protein